MAARSCCCGSCSCCCCCFGLPLQLYLMLQSVPCLILGLKVRGRLSKIFHFISFRFSFHSIVFCLALGRWLMMMNANGATPCLTFKPAAFALSALKLAVRLLRAACNCHVTIWFWQQHFPRFIFFFSWHLKLDNHSIGIATAWAVSVLLSNCVNNI